MAISSRPLLSKANLHFIKSLQRKDIRNEEGLMVAEGDKLVGELLGTGMEIRFLLVTAGSKHSLNEDAILVGEKEMERLTGLSSPSPSLAVAVQPEKSGFVYTDGKFVLVLDDIRDPGNLGTLIRTAEWFGYENIVCSLQSADLWNPKTIQASMGSVFRMKVVYEDLESFFEKQSKVPVYVLDMDGKPISECRGIEPGFLVLGNEAKGVRPELMARAEKKITISGSGKAESLNAAVAGGIALHYFSGL